MSYYILTSGINFKIHKNIFLSFESSNDNSENSEVTLYNKNSYP